MAFPHYKINQKKNIVDASNKIPISGFNWL